MAQAQTSASWPAGTRLSAAEQFYKRLRTGVARTMTCAGGACARAVSHGLELSRNRLSPSYSLLCAAGDTLGIENEYDHDPPPWLAGPLSDHICEASGVDQKGVDTRIRPIAHVGRKISVPITGDHIALVEALPGSLRYAPRGDADRASAARPGASKLRKAGWVVLPSCRWLGRARRSNRRLGRSRGPAASSHRTRQASQSGRSAKICGRH
jgi:hypothetical protein